MPTTTRTPRGHMGMTKHVPAADLDALRADYSAVSDFEATFGPRSFVVARLAGDGIDLGAAVRRELLDRGLVGPDADLDDLGLVHRSIAADRQDLDAFQINDVTRAFYDVPESRVDLLRRLVADGVGPLLGGRFLRQENMTLRFHFPEDEASAGRRDLFHTDVMLGHPPQMINVWVPVARTDAANSLSVVDVTTSRAVMLDHDFDFEAIATRIQYDDAFYDSIVAAATPVVLEPGDVLLFDARCLHAGQINRSDRTRISTDFRVIRPETLASLRKGYESGGRRIRRFVAGDFLEAQAVEVSG